MGWENAEGAAAAAVGGDLWSGNRAQSAPYTRRILAVAYIGGAAVGTGKIDLFVGQVYIGTFTVTTAAQGLNRQVDVLPLNAVVPANSMVHAYVTEAGATNPTINWVLFDK